MDLEQLKDAVIFSPGNYDPESPDNVEAPHEPITADTVLKPVDVVIFFDRLSKRPVDSSGCNQWAFVVDDRRALFSRAWVDSIKLSRLRRRPGSIVIRRIPEEFATQVAHFLLRYRWRPALFKAAINFLQFTNYLPFVHGEFFPADVTYESDEEYEKKWQAMLDELEPHDAIFTFDRSSWLSKLIAVLTHGPFSHVATHIGNGEIWEVVTSGARVVPIETYKNRHRYRVAVYRHYGHEVKTRAEQFEEMQSLVGNVRYGYFGAIGAGIKSYFGFHRESETPNGIILSGHLIFIAQA